MSDVNVKFEKEEEEEEEFVREGEKAPDPDDELPPEVKKKTKAQLAKELNEANARAAAPKPDAAEAVAKAMDKLADRLTPQEREVVSQQPGETEAQFIERLKVDLFDENKVGSTLKEAVLRYAGPLLQAQASQAYSTTLKLMRLDPETGQTFKKYEKEVIEYAKKNFRGYEQTSQALEIAFNQVKAAHIDEIANEIAEKRMAEAREKEKSEREAGLPETRRSREPLGLEPASGSVVGRPPAKRTITITAQDEKEAEERGVLPEQIARARARRVSGR